MSDTASPQGQAEAAAPRRGLGCCAKLALLGLVLGLALGGYAVWAASAIKADAPLPFEPYRGGPIARATLTAKLELNELPSKLTGGPAEVALTEAQLNQLLFGDAAQTDERKARVLLEEDRLRVEASQPMESGGYLNVQAVVRLSLGPDEASVEVVEGQVGSYILGPVTRPVIAGAIEEAFAEQRAGDPRLRRIKALWVEGGEVRMVYEPHQ